MRVLWCCGVLFSLLLPAVAVENQAYLGLFAVTSLTRVAGMPETTDMQDIAGLIDITPNDLDLPGTPKRMLTVRLWSLGIAPAGAAASLAVPEGLKQGPRLDLGLYRPSVGTLLSIQPIDPARIPDFTVTRYWGASAIVKAGQPETLRYAAMTPEQQAEVREEANKLLDSYYFRPDWTTGFWPTAQQPGKIAADAVLAGRYALATNYTGNVAIDVPATVAFLNPIQLTSPDLAQKIDLTQSIALRWTPVPGVVGYHAVVAGMKGTNTLVSWNSSEVRWVENVLWDTMQVTDVQRLVDANAMMPGARTWVTVPAGIFADCDFVNLVIIGFGPGIALAEGQPLPRVQTKTVTTVLLGGKAMAQLDNLMNMLDEEDE